MTQTESILLYLDSGNTLTPLEALQMFNCLSLHSRAAELRAKGHNVVCDMVALPNGKRVGRYSLFKCPYG